MENLKNVPTVIWYLIAILALIWIVVLGEFYHINQRLIIYWKRIETVINRIPVRQIQPRKMRKLQNEMQYFKPITDSDSAGRISIEQDLLLSGIFAANRIPYEKFELATWKDLGVMNDEGTENSDSEAAAIVHSTGDHNDK